MHFCGDLNRANLSQLDALCNKDVVSFDSRLTSKLYVDFTNLPDSGCSNSYAKLCPAKKIYIFWLYGFVTGPDKIVPVLSLANISRLEIWLLSTFLHSVDNAQILLAHRRRLLNVTCVLNGSTSAVYQ